MKDSYIHKFDIIGTIGYKPCELSLGRILESNPHVINRVMRTISNFKSGLKQLRFIPVFRYRKEFARSWLGKFKISICAKNLEPVIESHLLCCLTAYYREFIKDKVELN